MKYLSLIFLNLKAMKFREVNYFATVGEFHALFIYFVYSLCIYICIHVCISSLKEFNWYYKYEYKTLSKVQIKLGKQK